MIKKRSSIFYSTAFGRNDGPPLYYYNVLGKQLKLETNHLVPEGDISRYGKFDYHFWVDWGEDGLPTDKAWRIPEDGGKKIYVVSDYHLDKTGYRLDKAKQFDYVFLNQKWYLPEFKKAGIKNVFYLPHAAEPKAYPHFSIMKKWDVVFIGHLQDYHAGNGININRIDVLDYIFKNIPNFYFGTRDSSNPGINMFEDAAKKMCQAKVVFNISVGNDLNMRFFETLSTGSLLLTNKIPELKSVEERGLMAGKHFVAYESLEEAVRLIKYYCEHDKEREIIAKAGYRAFLAGHTYKHRIQEILKIVEGGVK